MIILSIKRTIFISFGIFCIILHKKNIWIASWSNQESNREKLTITASGKPFMHLSPFCLHWCDRIERQSFTCSITQRLRLRIQFFLASLNVLCMRLHLMSSFHRLLKWSKSRKNTIVSPVMMGWLFVIDLVSAVNDFFLENS